MTDESCGDRHGREPWPGRSDRGAPGGTAVRPGDRRARRERRSAAPPRRLSARDPAWCRSTAISPTRRSARGWSTLPASSEGSICSSTTRRSSGASGRSLDFDVPRFGRIFPVNAGAPIALIQLAVPLLAERRGLIVNITSDAAHGRVPGLGPVRRQQGCARTADAHARG